jgi:hypothetical protein
MSANPQSVALLTPLLPFSPLLAETARQSTPLWTAIVKTSSAAVTAVPDVAFEVYVSLLTISI